MNQDLAKHYLAKHTLRFDCHHTEHELVNWPKDKWVAEVVCCGD
jgi:hypothetical protein